MNALLLGYTPPQLRPGEHYVPGATPRPALAATPPVRSQCYALSVVWTSHDATIYHRAHFCTGEDLKAIKRMIRRELRAADPLARNITFDAARITTAILRTSLRLCSAPDDLTETQTHTHQ